MRSRDLARLVVIVRFGLRAPRVAVAQLVPETQKEMWSAEWITSPDGPQRDVAVLHFRKLLDLAQPPQHFVVHVSADNQFVFYVNQQRVGSGPSRSDLAHWKYESYDIAPFLRAGKNQLAAVVWNFGVLTPIAQISDRIGFVLHGDTAAEGVADTGQGWEVEEEKGIRVPFTPEAVQDDYYVAEPVERIDGTVLDWDWNTPVSNIPDSNAADSGLLKSNPGVRWKKAEVLGHAAPPGAMMQENNWQLVPD